MTPGLPQPICVHGPCAAAEAEQLRAFLDEEQIAASLVSATDPATGAQATELHVSELQADKARQLVALWLQSGGVPRAAQVAPVMAPRKVAVFFWVALSLIAGAGVLSVVPMRQLPVEEQDEPVTQVRRAGAPGVAQQGGPGEWANYSGAVEAAALANATVHTQRAYAYQGPDLGWDVHWRSRLVAVEVEFVHTEYGFDLDDVDFVDADTGDNYGSDATVEHLEERTPRTPKGYFRVRLIRPLPSAVERVRLRYWRQDIGQIVPVQD